MYTNIIHTKETLLRRLIQFTTENKRLPNTHNTKLQLIKLGLLENKCSICDNAGIWLNKPISLHLDHIDGNPRNNTITNLRILCPNCHSQTETYCGRNTNRNSEERLCVDCNAKLTSSWAFRCLSCFNKHRNPGLTKPTKIIWPDKEQLIVMIKNEKMEHIAKKLGVSSNAIKKHCKKVGIDYQAVKYFTH
jgi:hypothetical protein